MSILVLVRNFVPAHDQARAGEWNVADLARNSFDLEGKVVGTVGCGRIGYRVLQRLAPFGCKELLWHDYADIPESESPISQRLEVMRLMVGAKSGINARRVESLEEMVAQCDVVTIVSTVSPGPMPYTHMQNAPLHEGTKGLFNKDLISKMKKGAWLVNTARGAICVRQDVADALASGHLNGYAGDVWGKLTHILVKGLILMIRCSALTF
jgi:formate dehydrogenase